MHNFILSGQSFRPPVYNEIKNNIFKAVCIIFPDEDELTLEDTLANAHLQIEEKQYEAELIAEGFSPEQICKYGFAFCGKECLIG
ncbi:MAG: hypothetical protein K2L86_05960 [Lachnospiraceae bacterium]|nr:hypothetical protein [Lachnospiraceae bacterium]